MKHYIHCHQGFDLNKGGTVGYLSGLLDSMEQINKFDGEKGLEHAFLFPDISSNDRLKNPVHLSLKENTPFTEAYDLNEYSKYRQYQDWFHSIIPEVEALKINIKKITSIHIHGAYNFLPAYNFLRSCGLENKVVKILTTHNPWKPEHEDLFHFTKNKTIEQLEKQKANIDAYTHFLKLRDKYAFSMCDALFFPTKHSMDGYYESWPEFSDIIKNKPVYFSLTGTEKKDVSIPKDLMRDYLGIPREAKVLLYMGRFIPMRGYDLYVTAAKKILENEDNV